MEAAREGRSQEFTLPATPRNEALLGFARDPHTSGRFNASLHRAVLSAEGAKLLAGTVRLLKVSDEGYRIEIREGGARWAKNAARRVFSALGIDYHARLLPSTVSASWDGRFARKVFPDPPRRIPATEQPVGSAARRKDPLGGRLPSLPARGDARRDDLRRGRLPHRKQFHGQSGVPLALHERCLPVARHGGACCADGLLRRRLAPATAQGNHLGRVSANPSTTANSVGNIVETATPQTLDTDGEPIPELCNNGNCFGFDKGRIVFTPTTEVSVGFEYYLKYTTDHRILTRERLRGFDSVYLGTGADMPFTLANRYEDRRTDISPGHRYLAIVFDHTDGAQYRLAYTKDGVAEALWTEFSARTAQVTTPASGTVADPVLLIPQRHPLGTLCGRLGAVRRIRHRIGTDDRPSCGYEPPGTHRPRIHQILPTGFISTAQRRECRSRSTRSVHSDRGSRRHRVTAPQSLSPTSPGTQSGSRHCSKRCNTSST